ncbi:MAG: DASS family sodium-coupled anion symporter [Candidatus Marinimicrobia bacterium]|nr:DASS family sodium-coupled anion symporter [Candidatus Neomarinimicrobiota bacterium]MCF7850302.1 DASS family sodium-coupled anion symporter [Candidatus Neomarinimicrobiota bacterium]MCF7903894.1 DASS family sodium-coupled anion symporter [Candidatus Neomarinimicrobiota bacterium]
MYIDILFWIRQKKWLLIALLYGLVMHTFITPPADLTMAAYDTLIIISMALILIITEPLPLPAIAMLMIFMQVVLGVDTANNVASSFMNDAVFFIMGSLMLAVAIVSQGLDKRLALGIIKITGHKTWRIVVGFTAISAILSSFIGEHTVTAMMMPVGLTLVRYAHKDPRKVAGLTAALLFSIAYGATIGSIGTPSGGGRNVIMMNYWSEFGVGTVSYLEWIKYVYPMVLFQIPFTVIILLWTFKPEYDILDSAVRKLVVDVAHAGKIKGKEWLALFLFGLVFLGWVFLSEDVGLGVIALIGVFLYLAFGLVDWSELNQRTNWGVILLFGAAISIGIQMNQSGAAQWVAKTIIVNLSQIIESPAVLQGSVSVLLTGVMSNVLSSSATVAVVGPIVLDLGGDPILIGFTTAIASAFGYFTAVAAPACTIIYSSGLVRSKDFLRAGWKMAVLSIVSLLALSLLWWPLL